MAEHRCATTFELCALYISTCPLLNEMGNVLDRLVIPASIDLSQTLLMRAEHISTPIDSQRRFVCVIAAIDHLDAQMF